MIISFDLEKAKAGAKVVTRNGKLVDLFIRQSDLRKDDYPLNGIVYNDSDDMFRSWTIDGKSFIGETSSIDDLFIEVEDEEIRDNESEKIRKEIILHFTNVLETCSDDNVKIINKWITWLKNQNVLDSSKNIEDEISRWIGCEVFPEGTDITPLPKAIEIVEKTAKHFYELGLKAEQNPAELLEQNHLGTNIDNKKKTNIEYNTSEPEEDEIILEELITHILQEMCSATHNVNRKKWKRMLSWLERQKKEYWEKEIEKCKSDYLYFLCKYVKIGQKPTEWSKEDEHRRTDAIYFLETAKKHYASTIEIDATINWLKSLKHHQTKQEWSEEDEKMLEDTIYLVNCSRCELGKDDSINWLKSLKPNHWKPSKEQMEVPKLASDKD